MKKRKEKVAPGKIDMSALRRMADKVAGSKISTDLEAGENLADVTEWIPTGSSWLDAAICRGKRAGIPVGRVTELAGLSSTGKSYMAIQIAKNAIEMGIVPVYADFERAINTEFLEAAGIDISKMQLMVPESLETFLEIIEQFVQIKEMKFLFILDSVAMAPTKSDVVGDMNPNSSVGVKARVLAKAFSKLINPLSDNGGTVLLLNQLKSNIDELSKVQGGAKYAKMTQKYITPGGKTPVYATSLRIWLTGSTSNKQNVFDDNGFRVGSYVKASLVKSRFGTQDRFAEFKILWGDEVGILNEESLLLAIKGSEFYVGGSWSKLLNKDGSELAKWSGDKQFVSLMRADPKFAKRVDEIVEEEIILKFDKRLGKAEDFFNDGVGEEVQSD